MEFLVGTDLHNVLIEASNLARTLNLAYVKFDFNGVPFSVGRNCVIYEAKAAYYLATAVDGKYSPLIFP
jgi:hypothetical protein